MKPSLPPNGILGTRREFLRTAGALAAGAAFARSPLVAAEPAPTMQIGILLATFVRPSLQQRLEAAKANGTLHVQLSLDCAGIAAMPDEIPAGLAERIRTESAARGITIASLGGTFNMSHPDEGQRTKGLRRLRVLAALAKELKIPRIHICSGTRNRQSMWLRHPDNTTPEAWKEMVACVREAADIARQAGVVLGVEPEVNNVVDSAMKARRLMDEIGSPHLKITMDAANLFHAGQLPRMSEVLDEAFALVGKDVVMAHAKDLDRDGDAGHKAAGEGKLDYGRYMALLHRSGFSGPVFLHSLSEAQVPGCVAFVRGKLAQAVAKSGGRV